MDSEIFTVKYEKRFLMSLCRSLRDDPEVVETRLKMDPESESKRRRRRCDAWWRDLLYVAILGRVRLRPVPEEICL